jgi:hypothetical protein
VFLARRPVLVLAAVFACCGRGGLRQGPEAGLDAASLSFAYTLAQYCTDRAQALCEAQVRCGNFDSADLADCTAIYSTYWSNLFHPEGKFGTQGSYSPVPAYMQECACGGTYRARVNEESAKRCVESVRNAPCDPPFVNKIELDGCADAMTGQLDEGAECAADVECKTKYCEYYPTDARSGRCITPNKEGDSCSVYSCGPGLFCDVDASSKCLKPRHAGESCGIVWSSILYPNNWWCEPGLLCSSAGVCAAETRATRGQNCLMSQCPDGQACLDRAGCSPRLPHGSSCTLDCNPWNACPMLEACEGGSCRLLPGAGEQCSEFTSCPADGTPRTALHCRADAQCVGVNCVALSWGNYQTRQERGGCTDWRPWW